VFGATATLASDSSISAGLPAADNSGRRIALVVPGAQPSAVIHKKAAPGYVPLAVTKTSLTLKVPASVEEAADYCSVTARKMSKVGSQRAMEVCRWLGAFLKQLNGPATISPVGAPNVRPPSAQYKLRYMPDGRLKTIVNR